MVPQTGARPGNSPLRQRVIGWRCHRAVHRVVDLFPMGMASGVRRAWMLRSSLARRVAMVVLSALRSIHASRTRNARCSRLDRADSESVGHSRLRWRDLLALPQTWGVIVAKTFTDPVWFFVADWFPIYLVAKGIDLRSGLLAVWVPFIAADLGNFFGGGVSGYLIKKGWSLGAARKAVVIFGGIGVTLLIPTIFTTNLYVITALFALSTFCYASFSTIANVLPSDLYPSEAVATVSGLSGTAAGLATIVAFC